MGLKKEGKRLLKLGQKAAKALGREGRTRVEEVFATAIGALESELRRNDGQKDKKASAEGTRERPGRTVPGSRATRVPVEKPEQKASRRTATPRRRHATSAGPPARKALGQRSSTVATRAPSSSEHRGAPSA
jgi:hypothetical protein